MVGVRPGELHEVHVETPVLAHAVKEVTDQFGLEIAEVLDAERHGEIAPEAPREIHASEVRAHRRAEPPSNRNARCRASRRARRGSRCRARCRRPRSGDGCPCRRPSPRWSGRSRSVSRTLRACGRENARPSTRRPVLRRDPAGVRSSFLSSDARSWRGAVRRSRVRLDRRPGRAAPLDRNPRRGPRVPCTMPAAGSTGCSRVARGCARSSPPSAPHANMHVNSSAGMPRPYSVGAV